MKAEPLVSVIIPLHNRQEYIGQAINSILCQSFKNFELIIVDDASTDDSLKVISEIVDPRIKVFKLPVNIGVSGAFNLGIKNAKGKFIARLDSDDIASKQRIEKQVTFLERNSSISICGSWLNILGSNENLKFPSCNAEIKTILLQRCPISIGTSMMRKEIFDNFLFNESLRYSEDYEFWARVLFRYNAFNIPEVLVHYRLHKDQLTRIYSQERFFIDSRIKLNLLKKLSYDEEKFPDYFLEKVWNPKTNLSEGMVRKYLNWASGLTVLNNREKIFPVKEFEGEINSWRLQLIDKIFFRKNFAIRKVARLKILIFLKPVEIEYIIKKKF